jgi:uncharacterized cupin superfamily protein
MENLFRPDLAVDDDDPAGFRAACDRIGARAGGQRLGASLYRLPPGESVCPFHWHSQEEEMLLVIAGTPSVRTPDGWRDLVPGDLLAFPIGPDGAHQVTNRSQADADVLLISQMAETEICGYPDSGKLGIYGPGRALFRERDAVDYYDGEAPPDIMSA